MTISQATISKVVNLRHKLHQHPELSGNEFGTAKQVKDFIQENSNPHIIESIGGAGLAAIFDYADEGPNIAIRCELDALPIHEANDLAYRSDSEGTSHKCGHDGHMAIVAGLIFWIQKQEFQKGRITLLFQPAEETGKGAHKMLQDPKFGDFKPDYIFALHNIPGETKNSIIYLDKGFSAEVKSLSIKLFGKESHAAEPEFGSNPAKSIAELIALFSRMNKNDPKLDNYAVLTPIHINLGQKSYGISAGYGELHYTIRTWSDKRMSSLQTKIEKKLQEITLKHGIRYEVNWFEHFPASQNDKYCNRQILQAAEKLQLEVVHKPYPFKFGEDFGWFSKHCQTGMFGLGAGINTPALHNSHYDFPDDIIETGLLMFQHIIETILRNEIESSSE